ncbi:hypothetical protein LCDVSa019R [Lymphocystis disease virus 3]|uniref:SAP domain-containing protein n=1 Tax=Lymphocystis disease virus 3 TaxID=2560566 RepID=A0A1B2RVS3_9VIRU|nr:hypothetical protein BZK12_gp019 [Lymphocystis disease virus Sa]AOC55103.1 hypothetical protein LCDVSa019R [Lymphocystis disease virus 3]
MNKQIEDLSRRLASHLDLEDSVDSIKEYICKYLTDKSLILRGNLLVDLSSSDEEENAVKKPKLIKSDLETMTIANLKEICKKMNLKTSGNKANLVDRLLDAEMTADIIPPQKMPVKVKKPKRPVVFEKINPEIYLIPLPNHIDLLYDSECKLVFEKTNPSTAIGTYEDGHIFGLTTSSMELCKSKGLNYVWPSNIADL